MNRAVTLKSYYGRPCLKHPELLGLRRKSNATCVQCCRDASKVIQAARRVRNGKQRRVLYSPEEAAARIKARDRVRNAERRRSPDHNPAQAERKRKWRASNRDRYLAANRIYEARQLRENPQRRISKNLRHRIGKAMQGKTKGVSAVRDLGISIEGFRAYIAGLFSVGMTWANYGAWHLDHRRPLASFDLTDQAQALAAVHYTNYQPLWAVDNQRKSSKLLWQRVDRLEEELNNGGTKHAGGS